MAVEKTRVFVAGHRGMVGSALVRQLENDSGIELVLRSRNELDLTDQAQVRNFFQTEHIEQVYLAAAKVGGIHANDTFPAEFIYQNLMIECNVIHSAFLAGVTSLLFLGSSCIYPKLTEQPMVEESLMSNKLEPTNEPYAIAKIAGIKLCESYNRQYGEERGVDYRSIMPTNLYGPGDNYHPENSHVIPALIRRFHDAMSTKQKKVVIWGTGEQRRDFLHVDDLAMAALHIMQQSKAEIENIVDARCSHINVGSSTDISIADLTTLLKHITGFKGGIEFDPSRPDGAPRKLLDNRLVTSLGWAPRTHLREGLKATYAEFKKTKNQHQDQSGCL